MRLEELSVVAGELSVELVRSASPPARATDKVDSSGILAKESKRLLKVVGCSRGRPTGEGWGVECMTAADRRDEMDVVAAVTLYS